MGFKEIINRIKKGVVNNQETPPQTEVTPAEQPQGTDKYSLQDRCLSEVLGIHADIIANWRNKEGLGHEIPGFSNYALQVLKSFNSTSTDYETVLQNARDYVGQHFTVDKSQRGKVTIRTNADARNSADNVLPENEARVFSEICVSKHQIPSAPNCESYACYYADAVRFNNPGESETQLRSVGRQIYTSTPQGELLCIQMKHLKSSSVFDGAKISDKLIRVDEYNLDPKNMFDKASHPSSNMDSFQLACPILDPTSATEIDLNPFEFNYKPSNNNTTYWSRVPQGEVGSLSEHGITFESLQKANEYTQTQLSTPTLSPVQ